MTGGAGFVYFHRANDLGTEFPLTPDFISKTLCAPAAFRYQSQRIEKPNIAQFLENEVIASKLGFHVVRTSPKESHDIRSVIDSFKDSLGKPAAQGKIGGDALAGNAAQPGEGHVRSWEPGLDYVCRAACRRVAWQQPGTGCHVAVGVGILPARWRGEENAGSQTRHTPTRRMPA